MLTIRINVPLDRSEATALIRMAEDDCRQPREQLRYLLREAARLRGLLPTAPTSGTSQMTDEHEAPRSF
jgi:hypothetical protein